MELQKRVIYSFVLIVPSLALIILGGFVFYLATVALAILIFFEISQLLSKALLKKWLLLIFIYVSLPIASLIALRNSLGIDVVVFCVSVTVVTDSMAYFGGKTFGGIKLAPKISPKKTVSGFLSGIATSMVIAAVFFFLTKGVSFPLFAALTIVLSIISQIGDLFESYVKRKLKIKDSGTLIPGHGGLCDRLDGHIFVFPTAYLLFSVFFQNIFV